MYEFKCYSCDRQFEAQGDAEEYIDPVFGACARRFANCPACGNRAAEFLKPKPVKVIRKTTPSCGNGNCCCRS